MKARKIKLAIANIVTLVMSLMIFGLPLYFLVINSLKNERDARQLNITWPASFHFTENYFEAFSNQHYMIVRAFFNSILITLFAVIGLLIIGSMTGYVIQRRKDRLTSYANAIIMTGLMLPPSILPTIWVLQRMGIYKTILGMVLVEIALGIPFTTMLFRGYMGSVPREIEEAARIDGCGKMQTFTAVIVPLLKPIASTIIILQSVTIFNDFSNPLYFLPGNENVTVQLTIYNFMGKFASKYNLLFADIVLITIPMLLLFIFFNKKIIEGMAAGAVKG